MKKYFRLFITICSFCVLFSGCVLTANRDRTYMGFEKNKYTIVAEEDTHGGFLGDGSYYLILDCSQNPEEAIGIVRGWDSLPLSENLELIMYGGVKDGVAYGYELAKEAHWPNIEHGYYKFVDEQSDDPADDSGLFDRYSFNFEIAVYDTDSNMLYYFRFDT